MFNFVDNQTMCKIIRTLPRVGIGTGYGLPQVNNIFEISIEKIWLKNFEFCM